MFKRIVTWSISISVAICAGLLILASQVPAETPLVTEYSNLSASFEVCTALTNAYHIAQDTASSGADLSLEWWDAYIKLWVYIDLHSCFSKV